MTTGVQAIAIQTTLNEIKNVSPDVLNTFLFDQKGEIIAKDDTDSASALRTAKAHSDLVQKAETLGGFESATFFGSNKRMNIHRINEFYLAAITPKESDEKYNNTLTRVLVSTILRLAESLTQTNDETAQQIIESETLTSDSQEPEATQESELSIHEQNEQETEVQQSEAELEYQPSVTDAPATQFIIERIGGLLARPDTVRIENEVILKWNDSYGDRELAEVDLETLNGRTTRCRFKPIKDSKLEGKGIIQMPQKILLALQTSEGELVMVKPVID